MAFKSCLVAIIILLVCFGNEVQLVCICPNQQCLLERSGCVPFQALFFTEQHVHPRTNMRFFAGTYFVSDNISVSHILVRDTYDITISGHPSGSTIIQCNGRLRFSFINITNLNIIDIHFVDCGATLNIQEAQTISIPEGAQAAHFLINVHSLLVKNVVISHSIGYGMLCVNLYGESNIISTNFTDNHKYCPACFGGSFLLLFQDNFLCPGIVRITITRSNFRHSYLVRDKQISSVPSVSALGIVIGQSPLNYSILVVVTQTNFIDNNMPAVAVYNHHPQASYKVLIQDSYFNNSIHAGNYDRWDEKTATFMHFCYVSKSQAVETANTTTATRIIQIHNSVFAGSIDSIYTTGYVDIMWFLNVSITIENSEFLSSISGPAVYVHSTFPDLHTQSGKFLSILGCNFTGLSHGAIAVEASAYMKILHLMIIGCSFSDNIHNSAIHIAEKKYNSRNQLSVLIENTDFAHNFVTSLNIDRLSNVTIVNSQFIDNNATAIVCRGSRIFFRGTTFLIGNKGTNGGALSLQPKTKQWILKNLKMKSENISLLYLHPRARLILMNNKASSKGGAIYVDTGEPYRGIDYVELCFYQLVGYDTSHLPRIDFINNTAGYAGDSVYGGLDKRCTLTTLARNRIKFDDFFNISHKLSPSEMASDPDQILLCCNRSTIDGSCQPVHLFLYQGQTRHLYAIATRGRSYYKEHGATPALVNARIDPVYDAQLRKGQHAQKLDNKCSELTLSIYTNEPQVVIELYLSGSTLPSNRLQVTLLGCPFGFQLETLQYPGCVCETTVQESGCTCSTDDLTISCAFGKWIGNISNGVIVHHHCPLDYCTSETDIKVDALNEQCAFNHSGILCGECQPGLSWALGSSKCEYCSSTYLLLTLPFVLTGICLVLILFVCDITVSRGTLNGLIYFANVVQVNSSIFITQHTPRFLTVFVAWVNLDLGIQTCFYNGMDMYIKAWLQFVFPVYVWLIVAAIVLLSRHSMTISRLTRDNTVPVLATLFLLSYAKLLRAVITVLSFTYIHYPDGTHTSVWLYDGNVAFVEGKHAALFVFALVAMFGFIIPYTLLLLLSPYFQKWSHYRSLRWVNRLKPFLDANHGPYKNKLRNWTGIILLVRAAQFICFAANAEGDPNINLLVIALIGMVPYLLVWMLGSAYKNKIVSVLESVFVILLGTLASASLYVRTSSLDVESKQTVVTVPVFAIAFALFLAIMAYHSYRLIKSPILRKCRYFPNLLVPTLATELSTGQESDQKPSIATVSYVTLSELKPHIDD